MPRPAPPPLPGRDEPLPFPRSAPAAVAEPEPNPFLPEETDAPEDGWDLDAPDSLGLDAFAEKPTSHHGKTLPPGFWIPSGMRERGGDPLEKLRQSWPEVVGQCGIVQPLLRHHLKDSWPVSLNETKLVIGFDPEFAGEMEQVSRHERGELRNLFHRVLGRTVHLEYRVLDRPVRWSHHAPVEGKAAVGEEEPFDPATAGLSPRLWARGEAVRAILEAFHGKIIEIQP
jgi:hypothetical protein